MARGRPREFDRDEAVRRARDMFWERGYDGASISALTQAMGIASPSLYAAFGSKAGLFCEAADLYQDADASEPLRAFDAAPTARDGIARMLHANVELFTSRRARGCLLTRAAAVPPDDEAVVRYLERSAKARVRAIEDRLAEAAAGGEPLPDAKPRELAELYDTVVQGLAVRAAEGAGKASLRRTVELAMKAWPSA